MAQLQAGDSGLRTHAWRCAIWLRLMGAYLALLAWGKGVRDPILLCLGRHLVIVRVAHDAGAADLYVIFKCECECKARAAYETLRCFEWRQREMSEGQRQGSSAARLQQGQGWMGI